MKEEREYIDNNVLERGEKLLADKAYENDPLRDHFGQLLEEYRLLLRKFSRVTRISDGYQRKLLELNESLNVAARYDPLTGLSNRRDMIERMSKELHRAQRHGETFSLIIADIDHFKNVNDTFGHKAGDSVLVALAKTLLETTRSEDVCSRWGGEEFLICLPHTDLPAAKNVAEKLLQAVASGEVHHDGSTIHITLSAGVAAFHPDSDVDDMIRSADRAMYRAKETGRNKVCTL